jgi:group II intron reverse transcriptase/maturase
MVMKKEELSLLPVSTKQQRIAKIAKQRSKEPLTLLNNYLDEKWLFAAFEQLRMESKPGVDGVTVARYLVNLDKNLKSLLYRAKSGKYKAPPVRRAFIPKPGSKEHRPLGIPTTDDKVLQKAVTMLLEPIYEQEFYWFSFGFRPRKSQHDGLEYLWKGIMDNNIHWILDLDIRHFFDTVQHNVLQELLRKRVRDGVITRLIGKWLNAGIFQDGNVSYNDEGTPQGGIISPLLSNIYLHEALDRWYAEEVRPNLQYRSIIVRFADDAVLGFENREEAESMLEAIRERFKGFGLELHPDKTRLIYFKRPGNGGGPKPGGFDFLGFTHHWGKSHKGNWVVKRKTAGKKLREKLRIINQWCRENRHVPPREQHKKLSRKLKGHYAYYGITGNIKSLQGFLNQVKRIWKKWLCRRSWKGKRLNWERFNILLKEHFPLPQPKVVHSIYAQRSHKARNRMR